MTNNTTEYRIAIAKSQEELDAAYQLRYQVFFEEGGDARYANNEVKHWRDENDVLDSTVFVATTPDENAVATTRQTCLKHREDIDNSVFRFDLPAKIFKWN